MRPFNFASDSKLDLPHAALVIFTSKIFVVRPFRVVHEAKASHYIFKHPLIYQIFHTISICKNL